MDFRYSEWDDKILRDLNFLKNLLSLYNRSASRAVVRALLPSPPDPHCSFSGSPRTAHAILSGFRLPNTLDAPQPE